MSAPISDSGDRTTLQVAQSLLSEGFVPLRIRPGSKLPVDAKWSRAPVPSAADLAGWWANGSYNLGVRTGQVSALVVLDVDPRHGGDDTLFSLTEKYGALPETVISLTPSGGRHYWFSLPVGVAVANSASRLGAGLDIRGTGGQVVCYPSALAEGARYEFDGGEIPKRADLALFPEWMLPILTEARRIEKAERAEPVPGEGRQAVYAAGCRNDALFRIASSMRAKGMVEEAILSAILAENSAHCVPPLPAEEVGRIVQSARVYEPDPAWMSTWRQGLQFKARGRLRGTASNLALILLNDARSARRLSQDELSDRGVSIDKLPWKDAAGPFDEKDLIALRAWITNFTWSGYDIDEPSQAAARDACVYAAQQQKFNPIEQWIRAVPWDGRARIDRLLADTFDIDQNGYVAACSRILIIGAVQRALRPGGKLDYMVILVGPQGRGKSMFIEHLYRPWSGSKSSAGFGTRDAVTDLQGLWAVEVAELAAFNRSEIESIKDFISKQVDVYTPKYEPHSVARARRCILIGTTNSDQFLIDPTGNRRFLPISVAHMPNLDYVDAERGQFFAEALARIDEVMSIDGDLIPAALAAQNAAEVADPWDDQIEQWLGINGNPETVKMMSILSDALKIEIVRQRKGEQMQAAAALKRLGFKRGQLTVEKRDRVWQRSKLSHLEPPRTT